MNNPIQPGADCLCPQKDHPIIGQASRDQKMRESLGHRDMGFVNVEALTFVVPEECLYPKTFGIMHTSFLGRLDVGDQMDGFLTVLSPPGDGIHRSILFTGEQDSRGNDVFPPVAVRNHVIESKRFTFPVKYGALCRPTNIGPLPMADNRLKIDSIKLAPQAG